MGYAAITSGFIIRIAWATASSPVMAIGLIVRGVCKVVIHQSSYCFSPVSHAVSAAISVLCLRMSVIPLNSRACSSHSNAQSPHPLQYSVRMSGNAFLPSRCMTIAESGQTKKQVRHETHLSLMSLGLVAAQFPVLNATEDPGYGTTPPLGRRDT